MEFTMKCMSILIFAVLCGAASAGHATERVQRGECPERGRCVVPPVAPVPPVPPMPPTPPTPPEPPLPPPLPVVPESAHQACVGKPIGSAMTVRPERGLVMTGTCQKDSQGMYFDVENIRSDKHSK
jgi:hypothetical protein